ncbi:hypothetical protein FV228_00205 [Methylobacterium sp. WL18]|uniref:hypothetical protein n=1 Tax=Methylobacterium sp. WL18 TaxID=2603897 RepID=UPI0011C8A34F|nr:hypothetical protein [Methylobacterium sp. WL18]TXN76610.1 hypothetical protein FV228_00205 [Methylobacterium sp. WL18]
MTKFTMNPLLANLAAFEAMNHRDRRRAGKRARQEAAAAGYRYKAGRRIVLLPGGGIARFTMFSA